MLGNYSPICSGQCDRLAGCAEHETEHIGSFGVDTDISSAPTGSFTGDALFAFYHEAEIYKLANDAGDAWWCKVCYIRKRCARNRVVLCDRAQKRAID